MELKLQYGEACEMLMKMYSFAIAREEQTLHALGNPPFFVAARRNLHRDITANPVAEAFDISGHVSSY